MSRDVWTVSCRSSSADGANVGATSSAAIARSRVSMGGSLGVWVRYDNSDDVESRKLFPTLFTPEPRLEVVFGLTDVFLKFGGGRHAIGAESDPFGAALLHLAPGVPQ